MATSPGDPATAAQLVLRPATADDDPAVRELLADVFPSNAKADPAVHRWQYRDNPFGPAVGWVWEDRGRLVAHWACVPVPLRVGGVDGIGLKTADAATRPELRGRGLFRELGQALFADCARRGYAVALSHPNPNAARGVEQAGGRLVAHVPAWVRPVDDRWLARRVHLPTALVTAGRRAVFRARRGAAATRVDAVPAGLDGLWGRVGADVAYGIVRDERWWTWRYGARPGAAYAIAEARAGGRLEGAAVAVVRDLLGARFLALLELLADDDAVAAALVAALLDDRDVAGIITVALPGTATERAARAAGLRRLPRRLEPYPLRFLVVDCTGAQPDLARRRWSIAWGDLDHL